MSVILSQGPLFGTDSGRRAASWYRLKNTWNECSALRQEKIRKYIQGRIDIQLDREKKVAGMDTAAVDDPYANRIDDLPTEEFEESFTSSSFSIVGPSLPRMYSKTSSGGHQTPSQGPAFSSITTDSQNFQDVIFDTEQLCSGNDKVDVALPLQVSMALRTS